MVKPIERALFNKFKALRDPAISPPTEDSARTNLNPQCTRYIQNLRYKFLALTTTEASRDKAVQRFSQEVAQEDDE